MTTFVRSFADVPWHISRMSRQQGPATEHKTLCGTSVFLNAKGRPEAEKKEAAAIGLACLKCLRVQNKKVEKAMNKHASDGLSKLLKVENGKR